MNTLFIISGPSGCGKTSTMRASGLDNEIISFTTRKPRNGERYGIDYYFISSEDFEEALNNSGLFEHSKYGDNYYGITRQEFENKMHHGHAFVISDVHGMLELTSKYEKCVTIFIQSPFDEAKYHLQLRGEDEATINKRTSTYKDEIKNKILYDYVITNRHGYLDDTVSLVKKIIEIETKR